MKQHVGKHELGRYVIAFYGQMGNFITNNAKIQMAMGIVGEKFPLFDSFSAFSVIPSVCCVVLISS